MRCFTLALILSTSLTSFGTVGWASVFVIDPGHGGPGADQFNNGGGANDNRGAIGRLMALPSSGSIWRWPWSWQIC